TRSRSTSPASARGPRRWPGRSATDSSPACRAAARRPPALPTPPAAPEPREALDSPGIAAECGAAVLTGLHFLVARHLETGEDPPDYARSIWKAYLGWLNEAPPEARHQRLHGCHYSFLDAEEARFLSGGLIRGSPLSGTPQELVERVRELESQGLKQIMLYPPLNRQYRVIED